MERSCSKQSDALRLELTKRGRSKQSDALRLELTKRGRNDDDPVAVLRLVTQRVANEVKSPESLPGTETVDNLPHVGQSVVTGHELGELGQPTQLYDAL